MLLLAIAASLLTPWLAQAARRCGWDCCIRVGWPWTWQVCLRAMILWGPLCQPVRHCRDPGYSTRPKAWPSHERCRSYQGRSTIYRWWVVLLLRDSRGGLCAGIVGSAQRPGHDPTVAVAPLGPAGVRGARPLRDERLQAALDAAAEGLGLGVRPALYETDVMGCPAMWCWSRQPCLLLPLGSADRTEPVDWILCLLPRAGALGGAAIIFRACSANCSSACCRGIRCRGGRGRG